MTKIRIERLLLGWSQQELAVLAHVGTADVSRIETQRMKPYRDQGKRIARVLGLRPAELQEEVAMEALAETRDHHKEP